MLDMAVIAVPNEGVAQHQDHRVVAL